uniref:Uncharacterized protein n=1 Tax=Anguilla anguilla TaxID=7936 RepID=A0A0E9WT22_ANGAN
MSCKSMSCCWDKPIPTFLSDFFPTHLEYHY